MEITTFGAWVKVLERIFEKRLRNVVKLDEKQMEFTPGTVNANFHMRQMFEKYDLARKLYVVFLDL